MKYSLVLSVAVLLSSSGVVQGQNRAACLYDDLGAATLTDVPTGESGNYLRTCECVVLYYVMYVCVSFISLPRDKKLPRVAATAAVIDVVRIQFNMFYK